jgi:hypothetical protein
MPEANMCQACLDRVNRESVEEVVNDALAFADVEDFFEAFTCAMKYLKLDEQQIADELRLSRTTVRLWCKHKNLPVRALREPILRWMLGRIHQL